VAEQSRFLTLEQVAEELSTSAAQIYALVRRGELAAIRLGGRGQWRVERSKLETFISQLYTDTERYVRENPLTGAED
jgi:excisionase family DNA binding protein